jgi:hypothetical protein
MTLLCKLTVTRTDSLRSQHLQALHERCLGLAVTTVTPTVLGVRDDTGGAIAHCWH